MKEVLKSWSEYDLPKPPHGGRLYSEAALGPWGVVILELEFESYAEHAAWHEEFESAPRVGEWADVKLDMIVRGGGIEVRRMEQL